MRMTFALPLLALGLAACQTYPQDRYGRGPYGYPEPAPYPAPYPVPPVDQGDYRAIGTEPFWDLTIGRDLVFTDRGNNVQVAEPSPPVRRGVAGESYQGRRLSVNVVHARCNDGMSDRTYPDTVTVTVDGRLFKGCGANSAFFAQVGDDGRDRPLGEHDLGNTNWRVVSINGQPVPMRGYYFNFDRDRVSGKLGCNTIGGGYGVKGSTLTTGALTMTRMACPEMQYETQGTRIMGQPMTISESGDRLTLTNRLGTIELMRAR